MIVSYCPSPTVSRKSESAFESPFVSTSWPGRREKAASGVGAGGAGQCGSAAACCATIRSTATSTRLADDDDVRAAEAEAGRAEEEEAAARAEEEEVEDLLGDLAVDALEAAAAEDFEADFNGDLVGGDAGA